MKTQTWVSLSVSLVMILAALLVLGCEKRRDHAMVSFDEEDCDRYYLVILDTSESCKHLVVEEGKCYQLCLDIMDKAHQEYAGSQNKIVVAQISGSRLPVLFEGTPQVLREEFRSPAEFRDYVLSKGEPGSCVLESVAKGIDYLLERPAVKSGKAKTAIFVLSDLDENGRDRASAERHVTESLEKYGAAGGVMYGWYGLDDLAKEWNERLRKAGVEGRFESGVVARPPVPNFH